MTKDYTDLGYMNGWQGDTPEEQKLCRSMGHTQEVETIGNCLVEWKCHICKIKYKVDSSG